MKKFDWGAAKKGARVCMRRGNPARILCYDLKHAEYPIVAVIARCEQGEGEFIELYTPEGTSIYGGVDHNDLMMRDDDYLEKLERGEYGAPVWLETARIATPEQIAAQPFASTADEAYWRKMYAGMAMQMFILHDPHQQSFNVAQSAIQAADALIEELKKEKQ